MTRKIFPSTNKKIDDATLQIYNNVINNYDGLIMHCISLSTIVLNSRDGHEKHDVPLFHTSKTRLIIHLKQKTRLKYISNAHSFAKCRENPNRTISRILKFSKPQYFVWPAGLP